MSNSTFVSERIVDHYPVFPSSIDYAFKDISVLTEEINKFYIVDLYITVSEDQKLEVYVSLSNSITDLNYGEYVSINDLEGLG